MTYAEFTAIMVDLHLEVVHEEGLINVYKEEVLVTSIMKLRQGGYGFYAEKTGSIVETAAIELASTPVADRY